MKLADALRLFGDISVDYGKMTDDEIRELDDAIDEVTYAANCWERLTNGMKYVDYMTKLGVEKTTERIKGRVEKEDEIKKAIFEDNFLLLDDKTLNFDRLDELTIQGYTECDMVTLSKVVKGYWMPCEPDYDREGNKILRRGANCSECEGFESHPDRYCRHCGAWMVKGAE